MSNPVTPPKFWAKLFKWLCNDSFYEELQGDLEERFYSNIQEKGLRKAKSQYKKEVIKMIRPSVIKLPNMKNSFFSTAVLRMHMLLTIRNMRRNKVFSFVNVAGLAGAITLCLFAVNMIYTGYSYDSHHTKADRIYRVTTKTTKIEGSRNNLSFGSSSWLMSQHLAEMPQVEKATLFNTGLRLPFDVKGETINLETYVIDENFFDIFDFKVIQGNPLDLFNDLESIVITDKAAKKLFGNANPIGKQSKAGRIIRAVIESPDKISHLEFEMLHNRALMGSNMSALERQKRFYRWENYEYNNFNYFLLADNASIKDVEIQLERLSQRMTTEIGSSTTFQMGAQQLGDIMFGETYDIDMRVVHSRATLFTLVIAITILIGLAGFNYTNLSIARSLQRSKEIGIRKITGSSKAQVIGQFISETTLFSLIALILSLFFYQLIVPHFANYMKEFSSLFRPELNLEMLLWFVVFSLIVGFMAGIFPALHFAKISPLAAINNKLKTNLMSLPNLKKALVNIQMCVSTFSILFILLIASQKEQILSADLGVKTEGLITIPIKNVDVKLLKAELDRIPEVTSHTSTSMIPGSGNMNRRFMVSHNLQDTIASRYGIADASFQKVYQPKLMLGTGFTDGIPNETLVDERFLKAINQPHETAIGTTFKILHYDIEEELKIVGVLDNFSMSGISGYEFPIAIRNKFDSLETKMITLNLSSSNIPATLKRIEEGWESVSVNQEFSPIYVDDVIAKNYESFFGMMNLFELISIVIILITVLGQFGIALFNAQSRIKEIGIRKVLGADFSSLAKLFSKSTLLTLIISAFIAIPLVYFFFNEMIIPQFSMPLTIPKTALLVGLAGLWIVVIGIVLFQTWQTARLNPSKSLRNE